MIIPLDDPAIGRPDFDFLHATSSRQYR